MNILEYIGKKSKEVEKRIFDRTTKNFEKAKSGNIKCYKCNVITGLNHITIRKIIDKDGKKQYVCNKCYA